MLSLGEELKPQMNGKENSKKEPKYLFLYRYDSGPLVSTL